MSKRLTVGNRIPDITLLSTELSPVELAELCKNRRVVIVGLPGAFTPTCSNAHLPGYLSKCHEILGKDIDEIICIAVNDPFVLAAWANMYDNIEDVTMLSDGNAEFSDAAGLSLDGSSFYLGTRSNRFVMVVDDGVIERIEIEPSPIECGVTGVDHMIDYLNESEHKKTG